MIVFGAPCLLYANCLIIFLNKAETDIDWWWQNWKKNRHRSPQSEIIFEQLLASLPSSFFITHNTFKQHIMLNKEKRVMTKMAEDMLKVGGRVGFSHLIIYLLYCRICAFASYSSHPVQEIGKGFIGLRISVRITFVPWIVYSIGTCLVSV